MEIDLLTINTWKCDGDYYKRMHVLAAGLRQLALADQVILCQECFRTIDGSVDTLRFLSEALNIPYYFVPARQRFRSLDGIMTDSFSGLGILTNLSVTGQTTLDLPSSTADGGRSAQLLTLGLATGVPMLVANLHLTHLRDQALRNQQLESVLHEISRSSAYYRIIGGDLNARENSTTIQLLNEHGVVDCASHWVDHLFIIRPLTGPYPRFTRSETVLNRPDEKYGLYPSDHFGVYARLLAPD